MSKRTKKRTNWINKDTEALFEAILELKNINEAKRFLRDLLTETEILELANRWKAAQMLARKMPYSKIEQETGLSSTTVARVARWLKNGMDGYKLILKRFAEKGD